MDFLSPHIGQLIALLGTLAVAGLGFHQWRKQHSNPNRAAVAESRRKAAEALWSKLEEINLALRREPQESLPSLDVLLKQANTTFMKQSLYLDDRTQALIRSYVNSLYRASRHLGEQNSSAAQEWADTAINPDAQGDEQTRALLAEIASQRERVKEVLLGAAGA